MTTYRIRVATSDDLPAIEALWNTVGMRVYPQTPLPPEFAAIVSRNPDGFVVAEDDTGLVGTVIGTFDGRRGWIYKLCTREDRRDLGIGRALMDHIQQVLADQGCRKVNLLVDHDNQGVIAFYERLGFRAHTDIMLDKFLHIPASDIGTSG